MYFKNLKKLGCYLKIFFMIRPNKKLMEKQSIGNRVVLYMFEALCQVIVKFNVEVYEQLLIESYWFNQYLSKMADTVIQVDWDGDNCLTLDPRLYTSARFVNNATSYLQSHQPYIKFSRPPCQKGNERVQYQGFIENIDLNAFFFHVYRNLSKNPHA